MNRILQEKGEKGELLASQYLQKKGLKIIEKNWRCRWGEIDLIAQQGKKLIFIEVKARQNKNYGDGFEAVNYFKQQKIVRSALQYIQKHPEHEDYAFAVVSIDSEPSFKQVEYVEFPLDGFNRYY